MSEGTVTLPESVFRELERRSNALDAEREAHDKELKYLQLRYDGLAFRHDQEVADLRKRIEELEAQLQDEVP